jgi:hypothetical protein
MTIAIAFDIYTSAIERRRFPMCGVTSSWNTVSGVA